MTSSRFPRSVQGTTPDWVTAVLRRAGVLDAAQVTDVHAEPIGEQGQTSLVVRLHLSYDAPADDLPRSAIAKLPSSNSDVRAAQQALGSYAREVLFYRDIGDDAGIPVPLCYAADLDPDTGDFVLLLEDMSDCRVGDIWTSNLADVTAATDQVAGMHARW